jgi:hypothetical protein
MEALKEQQQLLLLRLKSNNAKVIQDLFMSTNHEE